MMASKEIAPGDVAQLASRLRAVVMQRQDAWLDLDITMPQLRALFLVRRRRTSTLSELADDLGQRLAAVSALVTRLVRAGLLLRSEDPQDRRRIRLELTDHAEHMLTAVDDRSAARFTAILGRMSPQGRQALAAALDELIELATTAPAPVTTATDSPSDPQPSQGR